MMFEAKVHRWIRNTITVVFAPIWFPFWSIIWLVTWLLAEEYIVPFWPPLSLDWKRRYDS